MKTHKPNKILLSIDNEELEYISSNFIKSFIDLDCLNNKFIWDDDDYLKEHYPVQFFIKNILK